MIDTQQKAQAHVEARLQAQYADQVNVGAALQGYSPQETLQQQITRRLQRESDNVSNLYRAQDILQRHPEFEELAWLIRSGLI